MFIANDDFEGVGASSKDSSLRFMCRASVTINLTNAIGSVQSQITFINLYSPRILRIFEEIFYY